MEKGDISNAVVPRFLFVFEGIIGKLPDVRAESKARALFAIHQWVRCVRCYQIDTHISKVLWDLAWRQSIQFDVVTFLGEGMADAIRDRLDYLQLPVSNVDHTTGDELVHQLTYRPNIVQIVHPFPDWQFRFGGVGRYVETTEGFAI